MNGKIHRGIAVLSVIGLTACTFPTMLVAGITVYPAIGLAVADAGAKMADIDHENSSYGKKYPMVAKLLKHRGFTHTGIVLLFMVAAFRLCCMLYGVEKGVWVEDVLILIILTGGINISLRKALDMNIGINISLILLEMFILAFITVYNAALINSILCSLVFGFMFAYMSHIFADLHNRKGVPLAFPLCRKRIFLMAITTGTWEEYMFLGMYIVIVFGQIMCTRFGIGLL